MGLQQYMPDNYNPVIYLHCVLAMGVNIMLRAFAEATTGRANLTL